MKWFELQVKDSFFFLTLRYSEEHDQVAMGKQEIILNLVLFVQE